MEFLLAPENLFFSTALMLLLMVGVVEALGLGFSAFDAGDVDLGETDAGPLLGWIGVGRLPLLMVLVAALAAFGLCGLALQQTAAAWTGRLLPAPVACLAATLAALPLTGVISRFLARIIPTDETSAVSLATLVGRRGQIVLGRATAGCPARARVRDAFGQSHYVLVEPNLAGDRLGEGDEILLVTREAGHFRAIGVAPHFTLEEEGASA